MLKKIGHYVPRYGAIQHHSSHHGHGHHGHHHHHHGGHHSSGAMGMGGIMSGPSSAGIAGATGLNVSSTLSSAGGNHYNLGSPNHGGRQSRGGRHGSGTWASLHASTSEERLSSPSMPPASSPKSIASSMGFAAGSLTSSSSLPILPPSTASASTPAPVAASTATATAITASLTTDPTSTSGPSSPQPRMPLQHPLTAMMKQQREHSKASRVAAVIAAANAAGNNPATVSPIKKKERDTGLAARDRDMMAKLLRDANQPIGALTSASANIKKSPSSVRAKVKSVRVSHCHPSSPVSLALAK
jgi:hypothetical protein